MIKNQVAYMDGHSIICSLSIISRRDIYSESISSIIGNNTIMSRIGNSLNVNGIKYTSRSSIIGYSTNTTKVLLTYYRASCIR